jgi:hypothetical protein
LGFTSIALGFVLSEALLPRAINDHLGLRCLAATGGPTLCGLHNLFLYPFSRGHSPRYPEEFHLGLIIILYIPENRITRPQAISPCDFYWDSYVETAANFSECHISLHKQQLTTLIPLEASNITRQYCIAE